MKNRVLGILLLSLFVSAVQSFAQRPVEGEESLTSSGSWRDFVGFQVMSSVSAVIFRLSPLDTEAPSYSVVPQVGPRVQLGVVLARKAIDPIVVTIGYCRAINMDTSTLGLLKMTSVLDMGVETPVWQMLDNSKHSLSVDAGMYVTMCTLSFGEKYDAIQRWGLEGDSSLTYGYRLASGRVVGCRLYERLTRYFSESSHPNLAPFDYADELGVAAYVRF